MAQNISRFISHGTLKYRMPFDSYCIATSSTSSGLCLANHLSVNFAVRSTRFDIMNTPL